MIPQRPRFATALYTARLGLSAAYVAAWSAGALAAGAMEEIFPYAKNVCWGRVYSKAHLAAHPDQTVQAIHLWQEFGERKHLELSTKLDSVDPGGDWPDQKYTLAQLYLQTRAAPGLRSERFACNEMNGRLGCKTVGMADAADSEPELLLTHRGQALQLERTTALGIRSLEEHVRTPGKLAPTPLPLTKEDVFFRLDKLPAEHCRAIEQAYAGPFLRADNPPLLTGLDRSAKLCLTGRGTKGMSLQLFLDANRGDWPNGIDSFNFDVTQTLGADTARTHLTCTAFDYAWRCDWSRSDDRPGAPGFAFIEQSGALVRKPGGAVLYDIPCLTGDCTGQYHASAKPIELLKTPTDKCAP